VIGAILVFGYIAMVVAADWAFKPNDLKLRYNAKWALVTGASSGIGKALTEKLAQMGLNVVLVALDDQILSDTFKLMQTMYPKVEFRKVGVNLSKSTDRYDQIVAEATKDIDVQIVFNNAGYLVLKGFAVTDLSALEANVECNCVSHMKLSHIFLQRMIDKKLPGCIAFTSSQAAFFPSPGGAVYSAGKAFLTAFAASLAIEARPHKVDVCCLMSGPVQSRFYDNVPKISTLNFFHMISSTPEQIAEILIRSVGRIVLRDANLYTYVTRLLVRIFEVNLFVEVIALVQPYMSDFKKLNTK